MDIGCDIGIALVGDDGLDEGGIGQEVGLGIPSNIRDGSQGSVAQFPAVLPYAQVLVMRRALRIGAG
jgi:hypothetical protein